MNVILSAHPLAVSPPLPIFTISSLGFSVQSSLLHLLSALLPFQHCLLWHSELSSSSISRFPFVTHFLLLISPSSLSFHPIRFSPARLPHSASPVFFTWVSSTRSSYIPEMPVTYGPHSSWSAVRPRSFRCRPCRHQRRCWERYRNASPLIIVTVPAALQIKILN